MELNKSILLLLVPSLLSFFSEVICDPCNAGNSASPDCLGPALSFASSEPIESPLQSPVSSTETESSPLPSPVSSPLPSPVSSTETESSPLPSPVSSPLPSPASSTETESSPLPSPVSSPLPSPVSSTETESSPLPSPVSSPLPSPASSTETESSPLPSPVSSPLPLSSSSPSPASSTETESSPSPPDSPTNAQPLLPYSPSVHNAVLKKICGATRFQAECLATIAPYQTGAADPISVIEMGIQALHKDFEEAIATVTKLSKDTSLSATMRDSLDICVESYEAGITDLNDALTAISTHDTDRLTQMLGAIASYPETCQDAFLEQGEESPLKDVDQKLDMLASITVDITILLPGVKIIE
ncbi:hypothetical protein POPTR_014G119400v4 [Populus trichocarpa]|uniref:Pectinesterase inhibitor domain-containing protein n=1 Tax=Populus trichocarpa TaxID=3694 RepID=A0A2K1XUA9_POPTR|nr:flocculation protein FLO11 [Populus trichocarpa]PNT04365.1 hypothetical protein POPTR_014G119400v4 [Populus trichocarpa]